MSEARMNYQSEMVSESYRKGPDLRMETPKSSSVVQLLVNCFESRSRNNTYYNLLVF